MKKPTLAIDYTSELTHHNFHLPINAFKKPSNEREYKRLEKILDSLIDEVKGDERHPLATAMHIIGDNLEWYDDEKHPPIGSNISDVDMVLYLMDKYGLYQKDLASIFGSQANVSKFLNGERKLNKTHIEGLRRRFNISADFFIRE